MINIRNSKFSINLALLFLLFFAKQNAIISQFKITQSEFIYEKAPFPSCHASTIAETPKGLVTAWFGGTDEGDNDVGIWVSRQENGSWTAPVEVANGVQNESLRFPCWNPVLFQMP
ncbi:MAG: exo-alpha-sialidase, partial [Bacteroidota bacterium]